MADIDTVAPNYLRAVNNWPEAVTLGNCYQALAVCHINNSHGLVEYIKAFLETTCRTILAEYGESPTKEDPSSTDLLLDVLDVLGVERQRGASKLNKVYSAFNKLTDALTEMRNDNGPVAHGKDGFLDAVSADHSRAFLHAGDAILGVILNAYEGKEPNLLRTRQTYDRFRRINGQIDKSVWVDQNAIDIVTDYESNETTIVLRLTIGADRDVRDIRFSPSRLLFGIDRQIYVDLWKSVSTDAIKGQTEIEPLVHEDEFLPLPTGLLGDTESVREDRNKAVDPGRLAGLQGKTASLLVSYMDMDELGNSTFEQWSTEILGALDANLELDWDRKKSSQARIRLAVRRTLVRLGLDNERADQVVANVLPQLLGDPIALGIARGD